MAATPARKGLSYLLSSTSRPAPLASRLLHRTFSSTPIPSAFASNTARAAASTSTPASKPAPRTVTPSFPAKEAPIPTTRNTTADTAAKEAQSQRSLTDGLGDQPAHTEGVPAIDWTRSYHGLGETAFTPEQADVLLTPLEHDDVEVKPDGILYLPEIKYRRILNKAFGPGGWGLAPRGESIVTGKLVTREYGLVVQGR
ncbi:hypothetical protein BS50DRAFT_573542 [Corynespora cassiicola Philippines]|uniref:Mitochondrial genome maintenance protein MGM101 n=1 Tax=Corynespora cassiicola Philippines TaxID=1448308 RepID=A0A2T2NMR5_CORCC|nr:hypothetical protein BS50DRAFT_573542 [Corynespora cassiicola Philippines]